MKKVASFALGCKVNQVESEAVAEAFAEKGYEIVDIEEAADVYVINTCTVTNFGDKKSRQLIRKVKRQNPDSIVVVSGCYAQTAPETIKGIEGVNIVLGTKGRNEIVAEVEKYEADMGIVDNVGEIMDEKVFEPISINKLTNRCRAYLKIQDGCSQFCTYCIIPYARGPVRSRPEDDVAEEVRVLAENGFKEVVLTGIHVASYGKELHTTSLLQVIERIHPIEGIERIRFSSVEPNVITEEFMAALNRMGKVCRHFHLSLQSGCDKTLKAMNRKYDTAKYLKAVETIRKYWPDAGITTDIIVGFPGETADDFAQSMAFARKIGFSKIHVFPYSPKAGTPAAVMNNQVSPQEKSARVKAISALGAQMGTEFMKYLIGSEVPVLFEQLNGEGLYEGHTSNYVPVVVQSREELRNQILNVRLQRIEKEGSERIFGVLC